MFSILRFILIVGAIFYYSPVRQQGDGAAAIEAFFLPKKSEQASSRPAPADRRAGTSGNGLEGSPRQRQAGGGRQDPHDLRASPSPMPPKPTDTLQPEDREPAAHKPRT